LAQTEIASLTDRLSGFFAQMPNKPVEPASDYERLKSFLNTARPYLRQAEVSKSPTFVADPDTLQKALDELGPALAEARRDGILINPWTMAGLKRNEVRNSAALAGLWSQSQGGETALRFLVAFFARLKPVDARTLPNVDQLRKFGYSVRVEDCPLGDRSERVDLIIESKEFLIGIEIKIDAIEGKDQLERYERTLARRGLYTRREVFLIYLTRQNRKEDIEGVFSASWRDVTKSALASIPPKKSERSFNHHLIANFAAHISNF
jgi:PD-(D/E)XK nuclease superfamily